MGSFLRLLGVGVKESLRFEMTQRAFVRGDPLTGAVHVTIQERIACNQPLTIELSCVEHVEWTRANERSQPRECHTEMLLRKCILCVDLPSSLDVGEHVYPFQYTLPSHLPPSFVLRNFNGAGCTSLKHITASVRYNIQVSLPVRGFFRANLQTQREIQVVALPSIAMQPIDKTHALPVNNPLSFSYQGDCEIALLLSKNAFVGGEDLEMDVHVHNRTSSVCVHATVRLVQVVTVIRYQQPRTMTKILTDRVIHRGLQPTEVVQRTIRLPMVNERDRKSCAPSAKGSRIGCRYVLDVLCKFPMARDANLQVPITVIAPEALANAMTIKAVPVTMDDHKHVPIASLAVAA